MDHCSKMKKFLAFFCCAASFAGYAVNLMENIAFHDCPAVTDTQKAYYKKLGITFNARRFPTRWRVTEVYGKPTAGGVVSFVPGKPNKLTVDATKCGQLLIQTQVYRAKKQTFDGYDIKFTMKATGNGSVRFGYYKYGKNSKFLGSSLSNEIKVDAAHPDPSVVMPMDNQPEGLVEIAFMIEVRGKLEITGINCETAAGSEPRPDAKWQSLDNEEKIAQIMADDSGRYARIALQDENNDVRNRGAYKLSLLGEKAYPARKALISRLLGDGYEPVRVHSAQALAHMGKKIYPELKTILLEKDNRSRLTLATAIRGLKGGVPAELAKEVEWANPPVALRGDNRIADGDFEGSEGDKLVGWQVEFIDGAEGKVELDNTVARSGEQSLKITKTNGKGYVMVSTVCPVIVPPGNIREPMTYRFHFKTKDAKHNTLLMARLIGQDGTMYRDEPAINGGLGRNSQERLRNTPDHVWARRVLMFGHRERPLPVRPAILLYGSPATVWVDDVQFPAEPWKIGETGPTHPDVRYTMEEAMKIIAPRPAASAKVVREPNGKVSFLINGKKAAPVLYTQTTPNADYDYMHRLGEVQLQVAHVRFSAIDRYWPFTKGWDGKPITDFSPHLQSVDYAVRSAPGATFIVGVTINWPSDFVKAHPEEAWRNEKGHIGVGYTRGNMRGFSANPAPTDVLWPSQYSELAWQYAGENFRQMLRELKKRPYAKIIAGGMIGGGHDNQFQIHYPDYSKPAFKAWRKFLRERYKTDAALQKAWNDPKVTIDAAPMPEWFPKDIGQEVLLDPKRHRAQMDHREFREAQIWKNSEYFARIFKEEFGDDKLVMTWCMGGGWQKNFNALLNSCYDAFVPQPSYERRYVGFAGGINLAADTFAKAGKVCIAEMDTRCWMRCIYNEVRDMWHGVPYSKRQYRAQLMKDAGQMIARNHGYWIFDLGSNQFRHPDAQEVIRAATRASNYVASHASEDTFVPGAALVWSQKSVFADAPFGWSMGNFANRALDEMIYNLRRSGVPTANYYLEDMMKRDVYKKHKVFVFLNCTMLTAAERKFIDRELKKDGNILIWVFSAGIQDEKSLSPELSSQITGFKVDYTGKKQNFEVISAESSDPLAAGLNKHLGNGAIHSRIYSMNVPLSHYYMPCLAINDPQAETLGTYLDGRSALAVKRFDNWTSILCAAPGGLDPELLYNAAQSAGVFTVSKPGLISEVNDFFVNLHSCVSGTYEVKLPRKVSKVRDVESGKVIAEDTDTLTLDMPAWKSRWLLLE